MGVRITLPGALDIQRDGDENVASPEEVVVDVNRIYPAMNNFTTLLDAGNGGRLGRVRHHFCDYLRSKHTVSGSKSRAVIGAATSNSQVTRTTHRCRITNRIPQKP